MNEWEAIKFLQYEKDEIIEDEDGDLWGYIIKKKNTIDLAIAALEKQVPNKPILYCHDNEFNKDVYRCSVCNCDEGLFKGQLFCEGCGQKLSWEE